MLRLYLGDDRVSMEAAVGAVAARLDPAVATTNLTRLDGASVDLRELVATCQSLPFLGGLRIVVVQRLQERLKALPRDAVSELARALEAMPPTTELILLEPEQRGDGSGHPLYRLAHKQGEVRSFTLAAQGDVSDWIRGRAAKLEMEIAYDAADELHRRVGDDAIRIQSEIEKLSAYCLEDKRIELKHVRELVAPSLESSIFDLVDAIGRREAAKALRLAQELLLRQGEPAARLLAMVGRQFRLLIMAKDLQLTRTPPAQMASQLETPAWLVRRLLEQGQHFTPPELVRALERVLYADQAAKGGSTLGEAAVVLQLVAELTAPG